MSSISAVCLTFRCLFLSFRCLLDALLSAFVSPLAGCDATDKGDATDEGAATDVGDVGLGMPTEESGVTSSNQAASSRTEVMPPFNTEQHRAATNDATASTIAVSNPARVITDLDASKLRAWPAPMRYLLDCTQV